MLVTTNPDRAKYNLILTAESLEKLAKLNDNIKNLITEETELDKILGLSGRLNGVFGEALGLAKLYSIYGSSANYEWEGKQKKGYDIEVTKDGKKNRFQIKASTQDKYVFRVIKVPDLERDKIRKERENGKFTEITERIKKAIEDAQTDVWLLIHTNNGHQDFFWIEKEDMIKIVVGHHENAIRNRKHPISFNEYIDRNNVYRPHIMQREDAELLNTYNRLNQLSTSS